MAIRNPIAGLQQLFSALIGKGRDKRAQQAKPNRQSVYDMLWAYYLNNVYSRLIYGGSLDYINQTLGEAAALDLSGLVNPVERVVECYAQNVFSGNFGHDIVLDDSVGTPRNERAVNDAIIEPIQRIWQWSNLSQEAENYVRMGAVFGTVGIRVVARVGVNYPDDAIEDRRVYLQFEHPGEIEDVILDGRNNVTEIITSHTVMEGELTLGSERDGRAEHTYRELMTKDKFSTERDGEPFDEINEEQGGKFANYVNQLGVVPYVLVQHRKHSSEWGAWCFLGSEPLIDRINAMVSHLNRQIHRHVNATWMVVSNGDPPQEFNFSGSKILYVKRRPGETAPGVEVQPLVAPLQLGDAIKQVGELKAELADRLPELKAMDGSFLSGQSGQTIAQLRLPAEDRIKKARANYEQALIRAQQIALSWGILLDLWEVGTGSGTREAADEAFKTGLLDHRFAVRPYLSVTQQEKLDAQQAEAQIASDNASAKALTAPPANKPPPTTEPPPKPAPVPKPTKI